MAIESPRFRFRTSAIRVRVPMISSGSRLDDARVGKEHIEF